MSSVLPRPTAHQSPRLFRSQFSLRALLLITAITGLVITLGDRLTSEVVLAAIWLGTLLLTYWKVANSVAGSWRIILHVTAVTGAIWMVGILGTHLMYVSIHGAWFVLLRIVWVTFIGTAFAAFAACVIRGIQVAIVGQSYRGICRRVLLLVVLSSAGGVGVWLAWTRYYNTWQPLIAHAFNVQQTIEGTLIRKWGADALHTSFSADGRMMAIANHASILAVDIATDNPIAKLELPHGKHVESGTFLPNGKEMVIVIVSSSGDREILRWRFHENNNVEPVILAEYFDRKADQSCYPLAVDGKLIVFFVEGLHLYLPGGGANLIIQTSGQSTARIEICLSDLDDKKSAPKQFSTLASAILKKTKGQSRIWQSLRISPSGNWMISTEDQLLFGSGVTAPRKLPGSLCRFLKKGDQVTAVQSWTLPIPDWTSTRIETIEPPFYRTMRLDSARFCRIIVFDCNRDRVVARSWWFPG